MLHASIYLEDTRIVATRKQFLVNEDGTMYPNSEGNWAWDCSFRDLLTDEHRKAVLTDEQWQALTYLAFGNDEDTPLTSEMYSRLENCFYDVETKDGTTIKTLWPAGCIPIP